MFKLFGNWCIHRGGFNEQLQGLFTLFAKYKWNTWLLLLSWINRWESSTTNTFGWGLKEVTSVRTYLNAKIKATFPENASTFQMHLLVLAAIYSFAVRIRNCLGRIYIYMSANQKYWQSRLSQQSRKTADIFTTSVVSIAFQ